MNCDYLIVGAGLFGSVLAERIAAESKAHVVVIDRRDHIGGNCWSEADEETGVEYHCYGTHIFHTNSALAWEYISRFTEFNNYQHQVLTRHRDRVFQMPINLATINGFYDRGFTPSEAEAFLQEEAAKEAVENPASFEEKAISQIGRPLYEAFLRGYTMKQWGVDPKELSAKILARLPIRYNYDRTYFNNARWQGIPLDGYGAIFRRLLAAENIDLVLDCDYFERREEFQVRKQVIYTGPLDRYFDYDEGRLDWRSVRFEREVVGVEDYQGTSVMNYADYEIPFTRIHEPRHLHPERSHVGGKSLIFREFSHVDPEQPYYPVNTAANRDLVARYKERAAGERTIFGGRLGDYAYYDMDITICAALKCFAEALE